MVVEQTMQSAKPFSLARLKTFTSFRLIPSPVLMVTASVASFLGPLLIEPLECALPKNRRKSQISNPGITKLKHVVKMQQITDLKDGIGNLLLSVTLIWFGFEYRKYLFIFHLGEIAALHESLTVTLLRNG